MFKRASLLVALIVALSLCAFASELNTQPDFEVISPKINSMGDVINNDDLMVSLKVNTSTEASFTLVRIDRTLMNVSSSESLLPINRMLYSAPTDVVDSLLEVEDQETQVVYDPVPTVDVQDYGTFTRDQVSDAYKKAINQLSQTYTAYQEAYDLLVLEVEANELNDWIKYRTLKAHNLEAFYELRNSYERAAKEYQAIKQEFDRKVRTLVVDNEPIVLEGALPYYNRTINNAQSGSYELIVRSSETGKIILRTAFDLVEQEEAAEDMIEAVKVKMVDIWKVD